MPFMLIVSIYTQRYQWKTLDHILFLSLSLFRLMADDWNERVLQMANSTLNYSLFSVILFYGLSFLLAIILIRVTEKWQADAIAAAVVAVVIIASLAMRKKKRRNKMMKEEKEKKEISNLMASSAH